MDKIEITEEFNIALELVKKNNNVLILGDAGSGKSTFLKILSEQINENIVFLAPTGTASVNLAEKTGYAQTIHSFFNFPPKPLSLNNIPIIQDERLLWKFKKMKYLVIDEISSVRVDLISGIDYFLRINLNNDNPFGGVTVVLVGDLMQLPPVVASLAEKEMIRHQWESEYFFSSDCFKKGEFTTIRFTKIFRQKERDFAELLNKIRYNTITDDEIKLINDRCYTRSIDYSNSTILASVNSIVNQVNEMELSKLPSQLFYIKGKIEGYFNEKNCPVSPNIMLKNGARVMTRTNAKDGSYYSGMIGTVKSYEEMMDERFLNITTNFNTEISISEFTYETHKYIYKKEKGHIEPEISGSFTQIPIDLAWAISIHKSQGQTLDEAHIDFGRGCFAHGQCYVALSRVKTFNGLKLIKKIQKSDIIIDEKVSKFLKSNGLMN